MSTIAEQVSTFVGYSINTLANNSHDSAVKAMLAQLRRGVGKHPASNPVTWEATFKNMPAGLQGQEAEPSYAELAVHIALTLFATHQQGKDMQTQLMHESGVSIGKSLGMLAIRKSKENYDSIKKRFDKVITADSLEELSNHLRSVIKILRSNAITLDYQLLARQLYNYQYPDNRDAIRLSWGRDFYIETNRNLNIKEDDE